MPTENVKPMSFSWVDPIDVDSVLAAYFDENEKVNLVVIGANNGKTKDFLLKYLFQNKVTAVLVEPIAHLFKELTERLSGHGNLHFENSAIYEKVCKKAMYRVKPFEKYPDWAVGLGSFKKATVVDHENQLNGIKKHVTKEMVNCITLDVLFEKYQLEPIDILQIDTEGYDYSIVRQIPFRKHRPCMIIMEYMHITFYQYQCVINLLHKEGYLVYMSNNSYDILAVDKKFL